MYIAHKSNVVQAINEVEWDCRRRVKGQTDSEYWTWIATITTQDDDGNDVITYPSEDFTIVECTDEDVQARLVQLSEYINNNREPGEALVYNIKWQDDIGNAEEILGEDGKSQDPKVYVQSHFVGDDTAKDKRILDVEWSRIRKERDRLLTSSDWTQANDTPLTDANVAKWKTYRTSLRDLPSDQSSKTKYSDITWPTKP